MPAEKDKITSDRQMTDKVNVTVLHSLCRMKTQRKMKQTRGRWLVGDHLLQDTGSPATHWKASTASPVVKAPQVSTEHKMLNSPHHKPLLVQ